MKYCITFLCIVTFILLPLRVHADSSGIMEDVMTSGNSFIKSADNSLIKIRDDKLEVVSGGIFNILYYIGTALSILVGAILGIQIMITSASEKAKVKEALIPYIIGCFIIFGAFNIWKIAINIFNLI